MKKYVCLFLTVISFYHSEAQPVSSVIKAQAMDMGKALIRNDITTFQKYMHPVLIKKAGGAEKMKQMADSMFVLFKQFGGSVSKIIYGNPSEVIRFKDQLQATIPQTTSVTTSMADLEMESTLIAISGDNGKNWYFLDTSMYQVADLRKDIPEISPDLMIPAPKQPKFIPKQ